MKMQDIAISRQPGFTLIELMVVIAILGIIAMIAIPSYQNTIRKTRRTEAKTTLSLGVQQMERCFTEVSDYGASICPKANTLAALGDGYFTYVVTAVSPAAAYTIKATATNKGNQDQDKACSAFQVDSVGAKISFNTTGGSEAQNNPNTCW